MSSEGAAPQLNAVFSSYGQADFLCPEQKSKHGTRLTWVFLKVCKADEGQTDWKSEEREKAS